MSETFLLYDRAYACMNPLTGEIIMVKKTHGLKNESMLLWEDEYRIKRTCGKWKETKWEEIPYSKLAKMNLIALGEL